MPSVVQAGSFRWGLSSAGRAPALQAGGHRFEPGSLHKGRWSRGEASVSRKGREIATSLFPREGTPVLVLIAVTTAVLFFVSVNQVLVRLWTRATSDGLCSVVCPVVPADV